MAVPDFSLLHDFRDGLLGRRVRSLHFDQRKKLILHFLEFLGPPVFEISERLPKAKRACAPKWPKDHRQRIELAVPAKVIERYPLEGKTPTFALRPIKCDGTLAQARQNPLLDIIVPNRAV